MNFFKFVALAASDSLFTDVNNSDWFCDEVQYVYDKGLMQGTSASTFEPDESTTRGMIVTGYGDGTFGPNDPITREQLATILMRFCESIVPQAAEIHEPEPDSVPTPEESAPELQPIAEVPAQTLTVTFQLNYLGANVYETVTVDDGSTVSAPANPLREGWNFDGWYTSATGGEEFDFSTPITSDLTLYAHWNKSHAIISSYAKWGSSEYSSVYDDSDGDGLFD